MCFVISPYWDSSDQNIARSQMAASNTSHRLSRCQVVLNKRLWLYDSWYPGHSRSLPVTRSLGHSVTRSLNHSITGHFSHSYVCWSLGNDQQKYEWQKWPEVINDQKWSMIRSDQWPSDRITKWPSDQVTKWPSDRVTEWQSDWVTKQQASVPGNSVVLLA